MDGLVAADVHIGRIITELPTAVGGQRGVMVALVAGGDVDIAILAGFLGGLLRPRSGDHVVSALATGEVHRQDGVFSDRTALHEQHLEVSRDREDVAQVGFGLLGDRDEILASVAHLHHAHARPMPVQHLAGGLLQHFFWQGGRSGCEIERAGHERDL